MWRKGGERRGDRSAAIIETRNTKVERTQTAYSTSLSSSIILDSSIAFHIVCIFVVVCIICTKRMKFCKVIFNIHGVVVHRLLDRKS